MTIQIGDLCRRGKQGEPPFQILALSPPAPFHPREYGLEAHMESTACRRGFWCEYGILNEKLLLQALHLYNQENQYPALHGIGAVPPDGTDSRDGFYIYRGLELPLPYTGKMLAGGRFLMEYSVPELFRPYWAYEDLTEFVFEKGVLTDTIDHRAYVNTVRQMIRAHELDPREKMRQIVRAHAFDPMWSRDLQVDIFTEENFLYQFPDPPV